MTSPLSTTAGSSEPAAASSGTLRAVTGRAQERLLVRRMTEGDEQAFEEFAETYLPALQRFAGYRLRGDRELVLDIVQTTVTKAIEKIGSFRGECALATWLCACCRREIALHFRRQGRRPRAVEFDDERPVPAAEGRPRAEGPERAALRREVDELVHMALDLLPEHYARALEWKYLEEDPVQEIAERLGLSPKAAESLLTRARNRFRDTYARLAAEAAPAPGELGK